MILRFLALFYTSEHYKKPLKHFLNRFVASNRNLEKFSESQIRSTFEPTVTLAQKYLGRAAFRPIRNLNAGILDSVLYGLAKRLATGPIKQPDQLTKALVALKSNKEYVEAYSMATTDETFIAKRLNLAQKAFAAVP
jgi:hypothetical protein